MAKGTSCMKVLKDGKISLKLTYKLKSTLLEVVTFRIKVLEDELRIMILWSIYNKLASSDGRIKLLNHEYLCLFEEKAFKDIPEYIQAFVMSSINPELKPIEIK